MTGPSHSHSHSQSHHPYAGNYGNSNDSSYNMLFSPAASSLASTPGGGDPMNRNSMSLHMSTGHSSSFTPNHQSMGMGMQYQQQYQSQHQSQHQNQHQNQLQQQYQQQYQQHQQYQQQLELNWDPNRVKTELLKASAILSHRCLKLAAKWAAEQVTGIPVGTANAVVPRGNLHTGNHHHQNNANTVDDENNNNNNNNNNNKHSNHSEDVDLSFNTHEGSLDQEDDDDDDDDDELDVEADDRETDPNLSMMRELGSMTAEDWYAKSLVELGEFLHAASVLSCESNAANTTAAHRGGTASNNHSHNHSHNHNSSSNSNSNSSKDITQMGPPRENLSSYGFYLRAYALYMAGERRKEEDYSELEASGAVSGNPNEGGAGSGAGKSSAATSLSASNTRAKNPYLAQLVGEVSEAYHRDRTILGSSNNEQRELELEHEQEQDQRRQQQHRTSGARTQLDAFGLYVYGMLLREAQKESIPCPHSPHAILVESILEFPLNWSAWLDLSEVLVSGASGTTHANANTNTNTNTNIQNGPPAAMANMEQQVEQALQPSLATHYMYHFFCAHLMAHHHSAHEDALVLLERLYEPLPDQPLFQSPHVKTQLAVVHYHLRELEQALMWFRETAGDDPYSLDHKDVYSNILYVKEDRVGLSHLAHEAVVIDKYRPETCCIVGNYYSLKQQRQKAVRYFQRALKLDRSYTSAWTLMGHEYVELKQTEQAMESYRRAVTVSPKDYRAWYGLGQTYEFLNMYLYALFYYRKAATLRPYDPRMWCAVGQCFAALHKIPDAIRAYERAVAQEDNEGIATQKLAALYRQEGRQEEAAKCYMRHLELRYMITCAAPEHHHTPLQQQHQQHQQHQHPPAHASNNNNNNNAPTLDAIVQGIVLESVEAEALLYLAQYYKTHGEFDTAALLCSRLVEYPGPEKEQAKGLLRDLRSRGRRYTTRSSSGGRTTTTATATATAAATSARAGDNGGMATPGGNESLASTSNHRHSPFQFSP